MSSGKKNYFRHSFLARNDDFVLGLIDKFDLSGYYYWFALIEICAEQCAEEFQPVCRFFESRLYKELKCNSRRLRPVLDYMQTSRKLVYNYSEKYYEIEIVNLSKYIGKYTNKTVPNVSKEKKIKEKKIKENKIKENVFDFETIYKNYPSNSGKKKGMEKIVNIIKTEEQYNLFSKAVNNYIKHLSEESWKSPMNWSTFVNNHEDWIEVKNLEEEYVFTEWEEKDKCRLLEGYDG